MAINKDKYFADLLANDSNVVALLGNANKVQYSYPKTIQDVPILTYEIANDIQANNITWDDLPQGHQFSVNIDLWLAANASPAALIDAVTILMNNNAFFMTADRNIPEINDELTHRHLVFTGSKMNTQLTA